MKISNMKNLESAIKEKSNEIEIYGDISETVLKSGMASGVIFFSAVLFVISIISAIAFSLIFLLTNTEALLGIGIISFCVTIFSVVITITIKAIQKADIMLSIKLHKYRVTKKNNRIILKRKGTVR